MFGLTIAACNDWGVFFGLVNENYPGILIYFA